MSFDTSVAKKKVHFNISLVNVGRSIDNYVFKDAGENINWLA